MPPVGKRGRHISYNKTTLETISELYSFIGKFPVYNILYVTLSCKRILRQMLYPHLVLVKMYELHEEKKKTDKNKQDKMRKRS